MVLKDIGKDRSFPEHEPNQDLPNEVAQESSDIEVSEAYGKGDSEADISNAPNQWSTTGDLDSVRFKHVRLVMCQSSSFCISYREDLSTLFCSEGLTWTDRINFASIFIHKTHGLKKLHAERVGSAWEHVLNTFKALCWDHSPVISDKPDDRLLEYISSQIDASVLFNKLLLILQVVVQGNDSIDKSEICVYPDCAANMVVMGCFVTLLERRRDRRSLLCARDDPLAAILDYFRLPNLWPQDSAFFAIKLMDPDDRIPREEQYPSPRKTLSHGLLVRLKVLAEDSDAFVRERAKEALHVLQPFIQ